MTAKNTQAESTGVLAKILTDAQMRRFERTERIAQCQEIAVQIKAQHPYMSEIEMEEAATKLLELLSKEMAASKMAHYYAIDEGVAENILRGAQAEIGGNAAPVKGA